MIARKSMAVPIAAAGISFAMLLGLTEMVLAHGKEHNPTRFEFVKKHGVPAGYAKRLNPLRATAESLAAGKVLYDENCMSCHGEAGEGDGEAAADLNPKPADIADMYQGMMGTMAGMGQGGPGMHLMHGVEHHHPGLTHAQAMGGMNLDAYMFWSISDGGEAMGSAMPAFKDVLSEDERWKILLYVANGFKTDVK